VRGNGIVVSLRLLLQAQERIGRIEQKRICVQGQTKCGVRGIRTETSSFVYRNDPGARLQCLLRVCIGQLVATSDVAETG